MRRLAIRLLALTLVCGGLSVAAPASALADPVNAPLTNTVVYDCGGVPVVITLALNPVTGGAYAPVAFITSSTTVGILVGTTRTTADGDVIFYWLHQGFDVNSVSTTSCTRTSSTGIVTERLFVFTPAGP